MPSSHLILCCPLLLLPPIPPSIRVFSNESTLPMRWPKYWSFRFSISPSSEQPGLISFRMDWLDRLAVQGTLKSLLQHHSSEASILRTQLSSQSLEGRYFLCKKILLFLINKSSQSSVSPQATFFFLFLSHFYFFYFSLVGFLKEFSLTLYLLCAVLTSQSTAFCFVP